jgi:hypothetical protein
MTGAFGLGDPNVCERAAADCERAARQLDGPIRRLTTLRGTASAAWHGIAGASLVGVVDTRRQGLVKAQMELQDAAGRLRAAAMEIRDAIRRAEERERARRKSPTIPLGPAV